MEAITLTGRTDSEGNLKLDVHVGVADAEVVIVVAHPREEAAAWFEGVENGWPPGFFEQTAGSLADDPIIRPTQGQYEVRESVD